MHGRAANSRGSIHQVLARDNGNGNDGIRPTGKSQGPEFLIFVVSPLFSLCRNATYNLWHERKCHFYTRIKKGRLGGTWGGSCALNRSKKVKKARAEWVPILPKTPGNPFFGSARAVFGFRKGAHIIKNAVYRGRLKTLTFSRIAVSGSEEENLSRKGSGIRDQGAGIRDQGAGIRDQGAGISRPRHEPYPCQGDQASRIVAANGPHLA
jgi:hypothetical protein